VILKSQLQENRFYFKFFVKGRKNPFAKFRIEFDDSQSQNAIMEDLVLEDPIRTELTSLNFSQNSKGVSPGVFQYAKNRIFLFLKAGGFTHLLSQAARNYVVSLLYEKIVGMKPANSLTEMTLLKLRSIWKNAVPLIPEEYRPKSIEEFASSLGETLSNEAIEQKVPDLLKEEDKKRIALIKGINRVLPSSGEARVDSLIVWYDTSGEAFATFDTKQNLLLFLTKESNGDLQVLRWFQILDSGANQLIREL
jgi:hypothetical protein